MILDTSAILSILKAEPLGPEVAQRIERSTQLFISSGTLLELFVVADQNHDSTLSYRVDDFLSLIQSIVEPVTESHVRIARQAYRRYGKGSGHPARLNFGDCFAYALARDRNEPLLFVGNDFVHTDIRSALTA